MLDRRQSRVAVSTERDAALRYLILTPQLQPTLSERIGQPPPSAVAISMTAHRSKADNHRISPGFP